MASKDEEKLLEYARNDNLEGIKECIANGVNVNYQIRVSIKHNYVLYLYNFLLIIVIMVLLFHYRMDGAPFAMCA